MRAQAVICGCCRAWLNVCFHSSAGVCSAIIPSPLRWRNSTTWAIARHLVDRSAPCTVRCARYTWTAFCVVRCPGLWIIRHLVGPDVLKVISTKRISDACLLQCVWDEPTSVCCIQHWDESYFLFFMCLYAHYTYLLSRSIRCGRHRGGSPSSSLHPTPVIRQGLGSRLPAEEHKGDSLLDRGSAVQASPAVGWGSAGNASQWSPADERLLFGLTNADYQLWLTETVCLASGRRRLSGQACLHGEGMWSMDKEGRRDRCGHSAYTDDERQACCVCVWCGSPHVVARTIRHGALGPHAHRCVAYAQMDAHDFDRIGDRWSGRVVFTGGVHALLVV